MNELGLPEFSASPSDPGFNQDPYPTYRRMRQLGAAFYWREYGYVCFSRFEEVNAILRDRRFGREITHLMSREEAGLPPIPAHLERFYAFESNSMLEREPPVHTRLRKLVNRAFVSREIERLAPAIAVLADSLMDAFPENAAFDLLPALCEPVPVMVIADLLGVPRDMSRQLLDWSHAMVAMYQYNRSRETEDRALAAMDSFSAYVRMIAGERRRKPQADLITALVEARESGDRLSEDELITTVILLLNAGHEATVHGFGNGIKAILQSGSPPEMFLGSPQLVARTVDEVLRFDPPLHLFTRFVLEDMIFAGIPLRKGQVVGLMLGSANRDENRYPDPDRLDPVRGADAHVSFGAGAHFCIGAPLARLEMATVLPKLFDRFPGIVLDGEPLYADRYHFHGLEKLMVRTGV